MGLEEEEEDNSEPLPTGDEGLSPPGNEPPLILTKPTFLPGVMKTSGAPGAPGAPGAAGGGRSPSQSSTSSSVSQSEYSRLNFLCVSIKYFRCTLFSLCHACVILRWSYFSSLFLQFGMLAYRQHYFFWSVWLSVFWAKPMVRLNNGLQVCKPQSVLLALI